MTARGLLFRLLTIVLAFAAVLAAAELALRLLPAINSPSMKFSSAVVEHAGNWNPRSPDFRGHRPGPKAAGSSRILALGDSFVWGSGVYAADAYPRRLERRLATLQSELDFEVVSWSRSGWNTRMAWNSVRGRLERLAPDLVLLGFTLNDPEPSNQEVRVKMTAPLHRRRPQTNWSRIMHRRSALYRLFWERFENRRQRHAFISYYNGLFTGPHWDACLGAMEKLREATRALGIPLVLVVMPVFDSQLDHSYSYRPLHRKIAAAAADLDIPVLDLLKTFRYVDGRRLAVAPFTDPHPHELAHRIAADRIMIYLVKRELVQAI